MLRREVHIHVLSTLMFTPPTLESFQNNSKEESEVNRCVRDID